MRIVHYLDKLGALNEGDPFQIFECVPQILPIDGLATPPRSQALSAVYGPDDGRLYLMRPDGYIGFKCKASDAGILEGYLDNLLTL